MAGLQIETPPLCEPVLLTDMKTYLKVDFADDDTLIQSMISAARQQVEAYTARSIINKGYVQVLDAFPYFVDTVMSQMAYPPSYYSLPRYSTTLWNYSQMIKLLVAPVTNISTFRIIYVGTDAQYHTLLPSATPWRPTTVYALGTIVLDGNGNLQKATAAGTSDSQPPNVVATGVSGSQGSSVSWATVIGGTTIEATGMPWVNLGPALQNELAPGGVSSNTFFLDTTQEPNRIFPGPAGSFWPPVMYVPNAVEIHFTAGYGPGVPVGSPIVYDPPTTSTVNTDGYFDRLVTAVKQTVAGWYENRESITPLNQKELPWHVRQLLYSARILDYQPTRG